MLSAVSGVAATPIRRIVGDTRDVIVLPNGIDNVAWQVAHPEPGDGDGTITIVSVMRLAPRKRPLHLLKMIKKVREQISADTPLKVVIIGDGPERTSLERYIRTHDLDGRRRAGRPAHP